MIYVEWSAVSGYVRHVLTPPERVKLDKDLVDTPIPIPRDINPRLTLGVSIKPRKRASKGNHKWKLSVLKKELKAKMNGR